MIRGEKCELGFEKPSEHVKSPPLTLAGHTATSGSGSEHEGLPSGFKWPITFYLDGSSSATTRAALLCEVSDAEEQSGLQRAHLLFPLARSAGGTVPPEEPQQDTRRRKIPTPRPLANCVPQLFGGKERSRLTAASPAAHNLRRLKGKQREVRCMGNIRKQRRKAFFTGSCHGWAQAWAFPKDHEKEMRGF